MKSTSLYRLWATLIPLLLSPSSYATIYTVRASELGWYSSFGTSGGNYIAGWGNGFLHRDFFVFNLNGLPGGTIASATLNLYNPGISSGDISNGFAGPYASETYQVNSVSTSISQTFDPVAGFNAIGAGTLVGSQLVSSQDDGAYVQILLNSSFITAANTQLGSGRVAVGGLLVGDTGFAHNQDRYIFGFSSGSFAPSDFPYLSLDIVPEPSMAAMAVLSATLLVVGRAVRAKPRLNEGPFQKPDAKR
jgi:hypothetical protein